MKTTHIICVACLVTQVLGGCTLRDTAVAPVELFIGHKTAVDMGLKSQDSIPVHQSMDDGWKQTTKTEGYKLTCSVLTDAWLYAHPKPTWVTVLEKVDQYAP